MNFSRQDMVTVNQIKADVLIALNDEEEKHFTSGFYTSQIQQALQELSFDTFMLKLYKDFEFPKDTLSLELPKGCFNIREIHVFNGDNCIIDKSNLVWIKDGYLTSGKDKGYTSRNKEGNTDPIINNYRSNFNNVRNETPTSVLFCSIQNGFMMFSNSCASYDKVRVEYTGLLCNIGETPLVPLVMREAVKLWVEEKCLRYLKSRNPRFYSPLWRDVWQILYAPFSGVWDMTKTRISSMDTKESNDLKEYFSKMNY